MTLGIDIHPIYQRDINWSTVKNKSDVKWVYVKVSDGTGPYTKRSPSAQIHGAKGVGLPVGGYHYAQPGNGAAQADVLLKEYSLYDLALPPMLDVESPFSADAAATKFSKDFLNRIVAAGRRPCIYLSSSWARIMRPDQWGIPGLIIWVASYGPNNGQLNSLTGGYPGRVDIHQYTSNGIVNGITARCDVNKAYVDLLGQHNKEEEDVSLKNEMIEVRDHENGVVVKVDALTALANLYAERFYGSREPRWAGPSGRALDLAAAAGVVADVDEAALAEELAKQGVGGSVTPTQIKAALQEVFAKLGAPNEKESSE